MKIKMTRTVQGSLDGVTVRQLLAGKEYDTVDTARGERLALAHIRKGVAVAAVAEVAAHDAEAAEVDDAPPKPERKTSK